MLTGPSCDWPSFRTRINTCCCSLSQASSVSSIGASNASVRGSEAPLPRGTLSATPLPGTWHRLELSTSGGKASGSFDGAALFSDFPTPGKGQGKYTG